MLYHLFGTEKVLKNRPASYKTCGAVRKQGGLTADHAYSELRAALISSAT